MTPRSIVRRERRLQVLIVDASAIGRQILSATLNAEGDIEAAVAPNAGIGLEKIGRVRPDVVVLDLELPHDQAARLAQSAAASVPPIPIVVCATASSHEKADLALRMLEAGAVAAISRPPSGMVQLLHESAIVLVDTIREAALTTVRAQSAQRTSPPPLLSKSAPDPAAAPGLVVAIGASIGGTDAVTRVLEGMPPDGPATLVVIHMPPSFTLAFARRLDQLCAMAVKEAHHGDLVVDGQALIAPGNRHLRLQAQRGRLRADVSDGPLVSRHRPSVDVLFQSVAEGIGERALGVLLTGMGDDGARGLLQMREAGATTLAQDEASCVVFGMPKEAFLLGAVEELIPLSDMSRAILQRTARFRI